MRWRERFGEAWRMAGGRGDAGGGVRGRSEGWVSIEGGFGR